MSTEDKAGCLSRKDGEEASSSNNLEDKLAVDVVERIVKTPGYTTLTGALSRTNQGNIYLKVAKELLNVCNTLGKESLVSFVKTRYSSIRSPTDLDMIRMIQGFYAAANITGDIRKSRREIKTLRRLIGRCDLKDRNIVDVCLLKVLFIFSAYKSKLGKGYRYAQEMLMCSQTECPSTWKAYVYDTQAQVYDILAHQTPAKRQIYRSEAISWYRRALQRDNYLQSEDLSIFLWYTTHIVHITLDMPTLVTIREIPTKHMVKQYGEQCNVDEFDIQEAVNTLATIQSQGHTEHKSEPLYISQIYIYMRKTQVYIQCKRYDLALTFLNKGIEECDKWREVKSTRAGSWFNMLPNLHTDLNDILQSLYQQFPCIVNEFVTGTGSPDDLLSDLTTASGTSHMSDQDNGSVSEECM